MVNFVFPHSIGQTFYLKHFVPVDLQIYREDNCGSLTRVDCKSTVSALGIRRSPTTFRRSPTAFRRFPTAYGDLQPCVGLDTFCIYSHSSCFNLHLLSFLISFTEIFRMKTVILNEKTQFPQSNWNALSNPSTPKYLNMMVILIPLFADFCPCEPSWFTFSGNHSP